MAKIPDRVKKLTKRPRVLALATSSKNGEPNVVPIWFGKVLSGDEFLLMANFMKKTIKNIEVNPKVAISVWRTRGADEGYQLKGNARIETSGKVFDDGVKWVKGEEPWLNPRAAVIVKVNSVYITTPGPKAGSKIG
jgi:predicted pyridoxine 5'-phosphate oxidase superfamily flavin-nucleotide-binding protein